MRQSAGMAYPSGASATSVAPEVGVDTDHVLIVVDGWVRLGREVASERGRHWRSRAAFARSAGVSERVIDDLEKGVRSNYADATLAAVEAALGWVPGTCQRVVEGGRVRRDADPLLVRLLDSWRRLSPDARAMLVDIAERAARDGQP